jgi:hypothetical protein
LQAPANQYLQPNRFGDGHQNEFVPPISLLDELMDAAYDCLQQFRARDMPDTIERSMLDKALTESNPPRLRALLSRFEKAIQAARIKLMMPAKYGQDMRRSEDTPYSVL